MFEEIIIEIHVKGPWTIFELEHYMLQLTLRYRKIILKVKYFVTIFGALKDVKIYA